MNTSRIIESEMIINPNTRKIFVPKELYNIAVVFDNNAEIVRLRIPRYFDECDFSTKQCIINYKNALGESFAYPVDEIEIFEDSLLLYWYITDSVTKKEGRIYFNVEFEISIDERGKAYRWSTIATELNVLPSLGNATIKTEDVSLYQTLLAKMHSHNNKDILDSITSDLINKIHEAVNHIGDVLRHIPSGGKSGQVVGKNENGDIAWVNQIGFVEIPTNISAFNNDMGYITSNNIPTKVSAFENDAKYVTNEDLFSGSYNDLTDKPVIPSSYDDSELRTLINSKVTAEEGKGLSSNDFTDEEKAKLALLTVDSNSTFILCNKSILTFSNNICSIEDIRITENSLADVYFTADCVSIAALADISVDTYDGYLTLTAENEPTGVIQATILIKVV